MRCHLHHPGLLELVSNVDASGPPVPHSWSPSPFKGGFPGLFASTRSLTLS